MKRSKIYLTIATLLFLSAAFSSPSIGQTVKFPSASGITLYIGCPYTITWSGFSGSNVKIQLYKGSTLYYTFISLNVGSYSMTVPLASTLIGTGYKIRITSTDVRFPASDYSNYPFSIAQSTVLYPSASGIIWYGGATYNITWRGFDGSNVKIRLYKAGSLYSTITSGTTPDGSYSWTVPTSLPAASDYKIRITSTANSAINDYSDYYFTIAQSAQPRVLYPSASGTTLCAGASYNITWSGFSGSYVKIELYKGNTLYAPIISSTSNDGSFPWAVSNNYSAASDYRIKITSTANTSIYDYSDNNFTIAQPQVLYPSASGITWYYGSTYNITWDRYSFYGTWERIDLYKAGSFYALITYYATNNGSYSWIVPTAYPAGSDYSIRVSSLSYPFNGDASNSYFTIAAGAAPTNTMGNTDVYLNTNSSAANRRAMPVTFTETGTIRSISIYHMGGSGHVLLGVYGDLSGAPFSLLSVTPATTINSAEGWQTVALTGPVTVYTGSTVWLSWVFETNPGLRYITGTPQIAQSSASWSGGMPATFGTVDTWKNLKFSIYCTYTPGAVTKSSDDLLDINSSKSNEEMKAIEPTPTDISKEKVLIYPNPTEGSITVKWETYYDHRLTLTIYDLKGSSVKTVQIDPDINEIQVDLSEMSRGMYIFELKDSKNIGLVNRTKILKR